MLALPIVGLFFLCACSSVRKTVYFESNEPAAPVTYEQGVTEQGDAVIQPNDILAINVASITFYKEGNTSQVFLDGGLPYGGSSNGMSGSGSVGEGRNTYLVDSNGYIDYPRVGKLKLGGLSTREAKNLLAEKLAEYLFQPAIEVRIVNFRITMTGEVGHEGPIYVSNHKVSIVDAIAAAGGIPITGRKDNVLVIREEGNKRVFARLDLNSRNVFNNPYYYLKQNDIVYVEPAKIRRQEANEFLRFYLPIVSSFITTALSVYTIVVVSSRR